MRVAARNAVSRCCDRRCRGYKFYGKRGVRVHRPWLADFELFVAHLCTLPGWYSNSAHLVRIDKSRGYEPGNLRWE